MPSGFPDDAFREFGKAAAAHFPKPLSDEALNDRHHRGQQFQQAWLAVRYRYRACADSSEEYQALFDNPPEDWAAGLRDEDYEYRLERALYLFFTSGLSVLESLAFGLYFIGNALSSAHFPHVGKPKQITLGKVRDVFGNAFPTSALSGELRRLVKDEEFDRLTDIRNVLTHRLSGMRNIRSSGITYPDGRYEQKTAQVWYLAGADIERTFDRGMTERRLDGLNALLSTLIPACAAFVAGKTSI